MSNCPSFEDLNALVDGALGNDRELEVRRHLDVCATCRMGISALTTIKQAVSGASARPTPPPTLRQAVMAWLPKRRRVWRRWLVP